MTSNTLPPYHADLAERCGVDRELRGHDAPAAYAAAWRRSCVLKKGHRAADTGDEHWCPCELCGDPDYPASWVIHALAPYKDDPENLAIVARRK